MDFYFNNGVSLIFINIGNISRNKKELVSCLRYTVSHSYFAKFQSGSFLNPIGTPIFT